MKPKNLLYMARLCGAVYESPRKLKKLFGNKLIKFIEYKDGDIDTQVAIFEPESMRGTLVIVFRGTQEKEDFITDIKAKKTTIGQALYNGKMEDIQVHDGFLAAYKPVSDEIARLAWSCGKKNIIVAGHSLGGSLASLCSYELSKNLPERHIKCVTFGSPRVGNPVFAEDYSRYIREAYRFVNGVDLVTLVPFKRWFGMNWCFAAGFRHVGKEIRVGDSRKMAMLKWFARIQPTLIQYHFINKYIDSIQEEFDSGEIDFKI